MKSVLISINPKWCELIASGKKTVEVRKTRPKLETPFKCYIYCTHKRLLHKFDKGERIDDEHFFDEHVFVRRDTWIRGHIANGKVIGEFVCDAVFPMSILYSNPNDRLASREFPFTCLTDKEIMDYLGNGGEGYGWHISDLVIYDEPKELSEFYTPEWFRDCEKQCTDMERMRCPVKDSRKADKICGWCRKGGKPITRPPQSWAYCEVRG